jgi:hypothetical protein
MADYDIAPSQLTAQIGFFPTSSWGLSDSDFDEIIIDGQVYPVFNWIQAIWNTTSFVGTPQLVVSNGQKNVAGQLIGNLVVFGWSGETKPFKARFILSSAVDRFGNTITSTPINVASPANSLTKVMAYGGQY